MLPRACRGAVARRAGRAAIVVRRGRRVKHPRGCLGTASPGAAAQIGSSVETFQAPSCSTTVMRTVTVSTPLGTTVVALRWST